MKRLSLSKGKAFALLDDEDYTEQSRFNWRLMTIKSKQGGTCYYASRSERHHPLPRKLFLLHRVLLNAPSGTLVDHVDRDGLNNQRSNLRLATPRQNSCNCTRPSGKLRGVYWDRGRSKWHAVVKVNYRKKFRGYFDTAIEAARAYDGLARKYHGEFAVLNFPDNEAPVSKKKTVAKSKGTTSLHDAASKLGHAGGEVGGPARAHKLSAEQRSEIARKAAKARWAKAALKKRKPSQKQNPKPPKEE